MGIKKINTKELLAENLDAFMEANNLEPPQLEKKSDVSKRMIQYILSQGKTASIETTEKLANAFGLHAWQLLIPGMQTSTNGEELTKLVQNFMNSNKEGKDYITKVAEKESEYNLD